MQNKKLINAELELVSTFKLLAQAYEEISVMKIQRVRSKVLRTRNFLYELALVFHDVRASYQNLIMNLVKEKKGAHKLSFTTLIKNGKTVNVFVSSNAKLYGDIVQKVFHLFIKDTTNTTSDIVIIGKVGKELFDAFNPNKKYRYVEVPDSDVKLEDLKDLMGYILDYEKVNVYYGRFISVVRQLPMMDDVSAKRSVETDTQTKSEYAFIFEPSVQKLFYFFETQIFTSFVKQTIHESHLANLGSRIKAMEEALLNIEQKGKLLKRDFFKSKKYQYNKRQNETMASISLWSKR